MTAAELFFRGVLIVATIALTTLRSLQYCGEVRTYMKEKPPTP